MTERELAILITRRSTTSWFDWVGGELWLCPDGLLRRSIGFAATASRRGQAIDRRNRPTHDFSISEIGGIVAADRRNRWLPWSAMSRATLKRGIIDHSLHIELGAGKRAKFLWLKADGGYDLLEVALSRELPGRFTALRKPFG